METIPLLNNPAWYALQTTHRHLALGTADVQRYPATVLPFIAYKHGTTAALSDLEPWLAPQESVYIVGALPALPDGWEVTGRLECMQMVCRELTPVPPRYPAVIHSLSPADLPELKALIDEVQPGFFKKETPLAGQYYGIREAGKLVAVAGERLRLTGLTEVSAVCTLPAFTGKGYAQQLVAHVSSRAQERGTLPFLQVLSSNARAIGVYEMLGFKKSNDIIFWKLQCP